jgi:hypothetical protein
MVRGLQNMTYGDNIYWSNTLSTPQSELVFGPSQDQLSFAQWMAQYKDAGSIIADPLFADAEGLDFTLLPNSPALALGFQPIDTSSVGPRFAVYGYNMD